MRSPAALNQKQGTKTVDYRRAPHAATPEVHQVRTEQLKIRLWELGNIHDALLKIHKGDRITNLNASTPQEMVGSLAGKLALERQGDLALSGHSFGAASVAQWLKSVHYSPYTGAPSDFKPVATFKPDSLIKSHNLIGPQTPLILLDIWLLPLRSPQTRWLWDKPLPSYTASGPGGAGILAVESQAFFKWRVHLKLTKKFLSPPQGQAQGGEDKKWTDAHLYYPSKSAHLSQSDFGILFPWVTKRVFASEEPERVLRLNVRAILQLMRERGAAVAPTSAEDMELATGADKERVETDTPSQSGTRTSKGEENWDVDILSTEEGKVRGWNWLSLDTSDMTDVTGEDEEGEKEEGEGQSAMGGGEEEGSAARRGSNSGEPMQKALQNEVMSSTPEGKENGKL
jgi:platelet-activating factor acetylhydrolase